MSAVLRSPPVDLAQTLRLGCEQLGLELSTVQQKSLLDYVALLVKWNGVYNLTAIRDPQEMVVMHLLDSLAIVPALNSLPVKNVLDVGTGAGLPGIPLAIARPDLTIDLVDTVQKKVAFLNQAKGALRLANVTTHHARVEALALNKNIDCIVSRAFTELSNFVTLTGHLLAEGGVLLAMKGVVPHEEIARLPAGWRVREIVNLPVPGLDAERCLVLIEKT